MPDGPLLDVQHLSVSFGGPTPAVDDVSFHIAAGETLGLVGESGSGKSVTAFSILRLLQPPGRVTGGTVLFQGRDLLTLNESDMRQVRGARISLIFQEPMTALNPVMRVGDQIAEALTVHGRSRAEARARADADDTWARIKADVLGVPVAIPAIESTAVLGAAILAAAGSGLHADLEAAVTAMTVIDRRIEPDPSVRAVYDARFAVYRSLYPALAPAMHALGE